LRDAASLAPLNARSIADAAAKSLFSNTFGLPVCQRLEISMRRAGYRAILPLSGVFLFTIRRNIF
jgi:hypothetical protein